MATPRATRTARRDPLGGPIPQKLWTDSPNPAREPIRLGGHGGRVSVDDGGGGEEPPPFEHDWTVRFADVDPFGIAHYGSIMSAIHDVSDEFMAEVGYSWSALATEHDAGFPLVEYHVEFESPMEADDTVTIELRPSLGERSARFEYTGRHEDGSVAFRAYEQRAFVYVGDDHASEIPDWLLQAMAPYLDDGEGPNVNQR